ncbi:MAG: S1C family serine protease [Rickettsiaceae bacterium]|nr:S1C family serine protease [Rickettsiaceae bacterium]
MKKSAFFIIVPVISVVFLLLGLFKSTTIIPVQSENVKTDASATNNETVEYKHKNASSDSTLGVDFRQGFAKLLAPLMPAVVNIYTTEYAKQGSSQSGNNSLFNQLDDFDKQLLERFGFQFFKSDPGAEDDYNYKSKSTTSLGSGFVIDSTGYVVTNHHVVEKADEINVKFNDGKEYIAKLIGSDPRTDIALLKIEAKELLPFVKFGDSKLVQVGDAVLAVGNPFGLGGSATFGIVSAMSRDIFTENKGIVDDYIQIDAAINMGNSGGPTFNMTGEVIGVNAMIYSTSSSKGNLGIGFAIPCNTVKKVIEELKKSGKINRGFLGIGIQDATKELVGDEFSSDDIYGVLVRSVEPNSSGDKAGLKPGDIIIEFNGKKVINSRRLQVLVADSAVDSKVSILVLRDKAKVTLTTKLLSDKDYQSSSQDEKANSISNSIAEEGIEFKNVDNEMRSKWNLANDISGVVVNKIKRNSSWSQLLQPGNVIVAYGLNKEPIKNITDLNNFYLKSIEDKKKHLVVTINYKGHITFISLPLEIKTDKK